MHCTDLETLLEICHVRTEILVEEIEPEEYETHKNDGDDDNGRC